MNEAKEQGNEMCISRRKLLKTAGCAGAAALVVSALASDAEAAGGTYPQVKVANIHDLAPGKTIEFDYPLIGRKNIIMDLGCQVEGGVGPSKSIVAYSKFCTHLGCSIDLDRRAGNLLCECHQSVYDPKQSGKILEGPAPNSLPKVSLQIDSATGDIYAVGMAGLIYGLRNNLLDGTEVR